jgi:3-hydroxybutyryl-CoA dehydrogenase
MKILVIGSERNYQECASKFGSEHTFHGYSVPENCLEEINHAEILFDFRIHQNPMDALKYLKVPYVFLNTTIVSLERILTSMNKRSEGYWFGFNGMPSFILHKDFEICLKNNEEKQALQSICDKLQVGFTLVNDQIGMVTPRIICMIINEAYYTLEEKTASREDIDLAMKTGTNYPYGPFEWCDRIGAAEVCAILKTLHYETGEGRFKVCSLLEEEAKANLTEH